MRSNGDVETGIIRNFEPQIEQIGADSTRRTANRRLEANPSPAGDHQGVDRPESLLQLPIDALLEIPMNDKDSFQKEDPIVSLRDAPYRQ